MTITVITCTYNAGSEVGTTLESVLSQTYADVEHIIIDGCSADDTLAQVRRYEQRSASTSPHRVKVLSEPDRGLYDAMNKGIKMAQGTYLVYMNAGDTFAAPDTLQTVADTAQASPVLPGVVYGDTCVVDAGGRVLGRRRLAPPEHLRWTSFRRGMLVCHQAFYARTDLACQCLYDLRYRYSADVDWCIRIMKSAECCRLPLANAHAVLAHFLDGGMTTAYHRQSLRERFRVMCRHYGVVSTVVMHLWFALRAPFIRRRSR